MNAPMYFLVELRANNFIEKMMIYTHRGKYFTRQNTLITHIMNEMIEATFSPKVFCVFREDSFTTRWQATYLFRPCSDRVLVWLISLLIVMLIFYHNTPKHCLGCCCSNNLNSTVTHITQTYLQAYSNILRDYSI